MVISENSGAKNVRHSREDVIAAALAILDEYGLADLTMRRLAATLDVQPSALYWHFPNKQTLLASVADRIVGRARPIDALSTTSSPPEDWKDTTRAEVAALRDALLAFRDGAEVVSSTLALGLGADDAARRLARAIGGGGFDERTSEIAAATLLHFILGHVSHEQQRMQADSLGVVTDAAAADPADVTASGPETFHFGVALLLTGLEHQGSSVRR